jgi:predicted RNA binding protein YcfA (HicA-like mRNA interferase family)
MKVRDVIKLVENDGWRLARTKGAIASFIIQASQAR